MQQKPEPFNWSNYQRTYNNAVDLVAQCVGYHKKTMKPLKAIVLKATYYESFKKGAELLAKSRKMYFDPSAILFFDGIEIKRGSMMQFDSIKCEYYPVNQTRN